MINLVEIQYNPYLPLLKILINGESPGKYSQLIQYADENIWVWKNDILDIIYAELREEFAVAFTGTDFDAEIFKNVCKQFQYCIGFKQLSFRHNLSTQHRLGILNQFIIKNSITKYEYKEIRVVFLLDCKYECCEKELLSIDVSNRFCRIIPEVHKLENSKNIVLEQNTYLFILSDLKSDDMYKNNFVADHPVFIIYGNKENQLIDVTKNEYIYTASENDLLTLIFQCFLGEVLLGAMRSCVRSLEEGLRSLPDMQKVISVEPIVTITLPDIVEVGKSSKLKITCDPPATDRPRLIFEVLNPEIISCDGMTVYGKQSGETILEVYQKGVEKPFIRKKILSVKRNRIQRIIMDEDSLIIGEGDYYKLRCEFFPQDADNVSKITWTTSDKGVATVDKEGNINALKEGKCTIWCIAENISAKCICIVKPYLKEILIQNILDKNGCLLLESGQETELELGLVPENCVDRELCIESSDYDVVNIVGRKLIGKNSGNAEIVVQNEKGSRKKKISVKVEQNKSNKKSNIIRKLFQSK